MFGKKNTKIEQSITPEELSKQNDKEMDNYYVRRFHAKNDSADIVSYKRRRNRLLRILAVATAVLLLLFIIATLLVKWGDLIISVDSPAVKKGIVISEDPNFKTKGAELSAKKVENVTNITLNWLPTDLDTSKNGSHNGKNYVAYTFYCKNEGQVKLDYDATLEIFGVAKSADEAVRVMVYKNGKPEIFGKAKYKDRSKAETDCTKFVSDTTVMKTQSKNFKVKSVDKYTVVIWIEGKDPECIDDIRNGHVRMRMLFDVLEDPTK